MDTTIKVVIAGASGKTGREVGKAILHAPDMELAGAVGHAHAGAALKDLWGEPSTSLTVSGSLDTVPEGYAVLVDFTEPTSAYQRILEAIDRQWDVVVGTTGFSLEQREKIRALASQQHVGAALIANFSLGAWLLETLALQASRFMQQAEVLEAHSATKKDRPSGTAKRMQAILARAWDRDPDAIPVHSIRLPGMVAHQTVIFGTSGQTLTLQHDVHDRTAYTAGVLGAVRKIPTLRGQMVEDMGQIMAQE